MTISRFGVTFASVLITLAIAGPALAQSAVTTRPPAIGSSVASTHTSRPAQPSAQPARVAAADADPLPLLSHQPTVERLNVVRCPSCQTAARKRLGVMPVKVGGLSAELGLPADAVAAKLREAIESSVAQSPRFLVVDRAELGDVLAEQRLANSGMANRDLAPAPHVITPAQVLLYATVDRLDLATSVERKSNSSAEQYYRRALDLEREAASAQDSSRRAQATLEQMERQQASSGAPRNRFAAAIAGMQNALLDTVRRKVASEQDRALRLQGQAQMVRREAEIEARKDVTESRTTNLILAVTWKAIDTATGAVVASGFSSAADSSRDEGHATATAFQSSENSSTVRHDALVNGAVSRLLPSLRRDIEARLSTMPFRAKVIKAGDNGVLINAGQNLGLAVGDTFGVRRVADVLTDPDTGEVLSQPGRPVGAIRVAEVFDKTARAQVIEAAGVITRGDELEWIGIFVEPPQGGSADAAGTSAATGRISFPTSTGSTSGSGSR
ncbi:MAG TPA: CsgG/HfaB family protein [Vicinamibacterales bacterium]|nr:CsgG/HfaB family protein [Vicinamibacterales bacterium]